jgi:hypothetical protein
MSADTSRLEHYEILLHTRMFFGHQSVGYNIIDGIHHVAPDLTVVDKGEGSPVNTGAINIVHMRIGRNGSPLSKIDAFKNALINDTLGAQVLVAMMKFCYVDFNRGTDVTAVFNYYLSNMDSIKQHFPDLAIMHCTVPLTLHEPKNLMERLKFMLKPDVPNVKRNEYNDLLRRRFKGKEPIFDLAELESTAPEGKRTGFTFKGRHLESLYAGYTSDGGHLNGVGQTVIAKEFLSVLKKWQETSVR